MTKHSQITLEAELTAPKGKEWDITIIGAMGPDSVVNVDGRQWLVSKNGKLYSLKALQESAANWDGVKVYDDHQTQEEFERRQGMRSTLNEWVGVITKPYWDGKANKLRAKLQIVESRLSDKLKNAWEQGVLGAIGLSIDTFPEYGNDVMHEGKRFPTVEGFKKILSVDIVGNPAAGGAFDRLLASENMEKNNMDDDTVQTDFIRRDEVDDYVSKAVTAALAAKAEEKDVEDMDDAEVQEALSEVNKSKVDAKVAEAEARLRKLERAAEAEQQKAALARTELMVDRKLEKAHLPIAFDAAVRKQFAGRVVEAAVVDDAIAAQREAYASLDPTGRVKTGGIGEAKPGIEQEERFALAFMERMMGTSDFRALESNTDPSVKERLMDFKPYKSWINNGKPELPRYNRMSTLLYEYFGGDPFLDDNAQEAATTSSLATVVKNTVNIMAANSYSQRELWWEPIVRTMEVDTIDDATLARVYGVGPLSVVPEGTAYTELNLADEEETASFVKHGNYIEITLETLMRDKIQYVQRLPQVLADTWYNTQADMVSAVFTLNSATGPVLADTGALFNATATTTPGGHANLLTAALSHANYSLARTAMQKQTDQPLGAGRRVGIRPRFLLVPVDLEKAAEEIRVSSLVPGADTDTAGGGAQTANIYNGDFQTIVVPTWTDPTDWALVADPARFPAIWMIYPRGQRTPQIFAADNETSGSMFTNDTLRFKARLMLYQFSSTHPTAPVSDFRPLHKSNVAG